MQRRVFGFCGGIGSGKSARLKHLVNWWSTAAVAQQQFPQVEFAHTDADKVGHSCYTPGSDTFNKVVAHFGDGILDEATKTEIDRTKLGALVFGTGRMPELDAIVWPAIAAEIERDIVAHEERCSKNEDSHSSSKKKELLVYVIEAAILPHMSQMLQLCDEVWIFNVAEDRAVERVMTRNGLSAEEALKRVRSQSTVDEKRDLVAKAGKALRVVDTTAAVSDAEFKQSLDAVQREFQAVVEKCLAAKEDSKID